MNIYIFNKEGQCICVASKNYKNIEDIHDDITTTLISLGGDHYIESSDVYDKSKIRSENGVIVDLPEMPKGNYKYDYINSRWVIDEENEYNTQRKKALILLRASDYTQFPDVQEEMATQQKKDWKEYRAKLRAFPEDYSGLSSYEWPIKPS